MRQQIKISKREMKEDKFTTFVLRGKDYFFDHWQYFAGGIAAVIIVVVATILIQSRQAVRNEEALSVFNRAMTEYRSGSNQLAIVDFKTIVDEFGSSDLAAMAAFNLGNAYFAAQNFADAKTAFEHYLDAYTDNEYFITSAMAGIAASMASLGDAQGAADKYREAAEKYPEFKLAGKYYLKAMQFYIKAGQLESAKVMFAKITNEFEDTAYYTEGARLAAEYHILL